LNLVITKMGQPRWLSAAPVCADTYGDIRVRGTRVTLDMIVTTFRAGATAEEIAQKFPTIALADVCQVIAHYLNHITEIDAYLSQREATAAALPWSSNSKKCFDPVGFRSRLLARRNAGHANP
jgi:uncharacterized protein (DUF433 family)